MSWMLWMLRMQTLRDVVDGAVMLCCCDAVVLYRAAVLP
jgi:hypothetical protein